jgi:predicted kinase
MSKKIPLHSLVLMVGPSGAGKSTIISSHFEDYEVVSSDAIRHELVGDFGRQDFNTLVFREINHRVQIKLDLGERVVVDATHLSKPERMSTVAIGQRMGVPIFYVVVNRPLEEKLATQGWRAQVPDLVERHDTKFLNCENEILRGDNIATVIDTRQEDFEVVRKLPKENLEQRVLDLGFKGVMALGDVHGVRESLKTAIDWAISRNLYMVFLGDVIDYGPNSLDCLDIVYDIVARGRGAMIIGNHEKKIDRWISQDRMFRNTGKPITVKLSDGNKATTTLVEALTPENRVRFECKFNALLNLSKNHINMGNFLFTHGGAEPEMFKMHDFRLGDRRLESIAVYGEVDKNKQYNENGYPNRVYNWVNRIPNGKQVVVGHDIRSSIKPLVEHGTNGGTATFLDTGSGKGGHLTTAHIIYQGDGKWKIEAFTRH